MSTRRTRTSLGTAIAIATLLLGCATWWFAWRNEPRVEDTTKATTHDATSPPDAVAANAPLDANASSTTTASPSRDRAVEATPPPPTDTTTPAVLHVRLRGLHPEAPWTTPLRLDTEDAPWITPSNLGIDGAQQRVREPRPSATVDANGRAQFEMAGALRNVTKGSIRGDDPSYSRLEYAFDSPLDFANDLVLDVQVVARLTGRVVDDSGTPVPNANVIVFALRDGRLVGGPLTSTSPAADTGRYELRVPPSTPLLVAATPDPIGSLQLPKVRHENTGRAEVHIEPRTDLAPAGTKTTGFAGRVTELPDLVMRSASPVRGVVRWSDGPPIEGAMVYWHPRDGEVLGAGVGTLSLSSDGRIVPAGITATQSDGTFSFHAEAGNAIVMRVMRIGDRRAVGEWPEQTIVVPQNVEFTIPRPVTLRATRHDLAMANPRFDYEAANGKHSFAGDDSGSCEMIVLAAAKVRASDDRAQSAWHSVGPDAAGTTLTLDLVDELGTLSLAIDAEYRERQAMIEWRALDGHAEHDGAQVATRKDQSDVFELHVAPGRYRITVSPIGHPGRFLLPIERDVDIGTEPARAELSATFGGLLAVHATDSNGLFVSGTFRVIARDGEDISERMTFSPSLFGAARREAAKSLRLVTEGPTRLARALPPGDYELVFDFVGFGARRTKVTIEPRKVAEVRIRL